MRTKKWRDMKPSYHQRTVMLRSCGKRCFLGTKKSFPICKKKTCARSRLGILAAFIRAREWQSKTGKRKYKVVASRARRLLRQKKVDQ